ncbi:NFACT RNA binding domain-containing protein [Adhaeribacter aquaticus]|uniref:NFACT RNA binding domain-containing protein n=1 Tax=Adhaeribacter aquaticus TaxID=299567 RepID=UPI0003FC459D|nr:NFACT RNA binding domain-containing protein [Adhaeribacter aquaticus]
MHNNFYFLRHLSAALKQKLIGFWVTACFSQNKYELITALTNGTEDFYIKAILSPQFSALSFPPVFNRAKANSINLFPEIISKTIIDVVQQENERSFYLALEDNLSFLFKMFGNRSNIVLFQEDEPINLFRKKFDKDLELRLSGLNRTLQTTQEYFLQNKPSLQKLYPTFGDVPAKYLNQQGYESAPPEKQWKLLQQTLHLLESPNYYIIKLANTTRLSLLPIGEIKATFDEPITAVQNFVRSYLTEYNFEKNYNLVQQQIKKKLEGSGNYLEQLEYKALELEYDNSFAQTADLIMANLTQIKPGSTEVEVFDFYHDKQTVIKLSGKETPQKFAERLYKKNKSRQIELKYVQERIEAKKKENTLLETQANQLNKITSYRELKVFIQQHNLLPTEKKEETQHLFRTFETEGFKILVGKNAKNNDLLTQQHTYKEDMWLHAKDVSGSHVVIKFQAGKNIPESVLEKAAQLAAWYSKRKNDSLCPVLYTPKKYVRKPKGAEPGEVFVEREKVLLVKPENPFSQYPE